MEKQTGSYKMLDKWLQSNQFQTIIIDISKNNLDDSKRIVGNTIEKYWDNLNSDGIIWIICRNKVYDTTIQPIPFIIAEDLLSKKLKLKNIIIWPNFQKSQKSNIFIDITYYILFFVKNNNYYFDIDPVREKHIWKDVEWGKRKKNYNEKGKNPGNFWFKTEDDGQGKITRHLPLSYRKMLERIIKCSSKQYYSVLLKNTDKIEDFQINGVQIIHEK